MNSEQIKDKEHLAESLDRLIQIEVIRRTSDESTYAEKFDTLVYDLEQLINDSMALLDDYKSQGLTFNSIEAEGYHRAMLTVREIINDYKN